MRNLAILLVAFIFLLSPVYAASLKEWNVEITINDDGTADWIVSRMYNDTGGKQDYFLFSKITNLEVTADDVIIKCSVTEDIGTTILCDNLSAGKIVYKFRSLGLVNAIRDSKTFRHRFSMVQLLDKFYLKIKLPLGAVIVESSKLEGTGIKRFEPSWGREGSDGRRIFVEWIANEPKLGETYDVSVVYEGLAREQPANIPITIIIVVIAALAVIFTFFIFRYRTPMKDILPVLTEGERKVIKIVMSEKEVDQRKIVKELDFSKTKVSRIIRDLANRGLVEKTPKGRTNIIRLSKKKKGK